MVVSLNSRLESNKEERSVRLRDLIEMVKVGHVTRFSWRATGYEPFELAN